MARGAEHFAAELSCGLVFEVYPLRDSGHPTTSLRIGFTVDSCDETVARISVAGHRIHSKPADTEWGRMAVAADPDGHKVEIVERRSES